ncbi:hypothetical protein ACIP2Y_20680 [Streptomyces sviceus]|uniref:hypothetical protein n=1 Tax=Streptomyces sviceus TaxID=285530 RepID=UPI0038241308
MDAEAKGVGLEGALGPVGLGRAHHTAVAVGVGPLLGHEEVGGSGADAVDPGLLVDLLVDQVLGGYLEFGAGEAGLDAELEVLRLLVVVRAVARQVAAREAVVDLLQSLDGDVTGAVAGLVDGEGDDQGRDDVGVGGAVRQGYAVAAGVAGDDEGGVVAEQALLDAFRLLLEPGDLLVLPVGSEVVEVTGLFGASPLA